MPDNESVNPDHIHMALHQSDFIAGRGGTRRYSLAALVERVVAAFIDEHAEQSERLLSADTESKKLKLILGTVDYVLSIESLVLEPALKAWLIRSTYSEIFGFGPLDPLVADSRITTIAIDGADHISVRYGHNELVSVGRIFEDNLHLSGIVRRLIGPVLADRLTEYPIIETGLMINGRRVCVHLAAPPAAVRMTVDIRLHPMEPPTLDQLVEQEVVTPRVARWIVALACSPYGVMVVGDVESGKTTLMGLLTQIISAALQTGLVAVERTPGLHLPNSVVGLNPVWDQQEDVMPSFGMCIADALALSPACIVLDEFHASEEHSLADLLLHEKPMRQLWTIRGPVSVRKLLSALTIFAHRSDPGQGEQIVRSMFEQLPFVIMLRRRHGRIEVCNIGEWQSNQNEEHPNFVSLFNADSEGLKPTGNNPARQFELPDEDC